jgi:hypothetical protein
LAFDNENNKSTITTTEKNVCANGHKNHVYVANSDITDMMHIGKCEAEGANKYVGTFSTEVTSYNLATKEFTLGYSYPVFDECILNANPMVTYPSITDDQYKCLHYLEKTQDNFYCVTCKFGYTGKILEANTQTYVVCDTPVAGCSSDFYGGFYLNKESYVAHEIDTAVVVPCHSCPSGQIPFYHIAFSNSSDPNVVVPKPFSMNQATVPEVANGNDNQTKCLAPEAASFNMNNVNFTMTFPSNCGIGLVNTSASKDYTSSGTQTLFCLECASGYRKVIDASSHVTTNCEIIPNCDPNRTHHWFNNCSKCLPSYAWTWSSGRGPHFDECVTREIDNCAVVSGVGANQTCKFCAKGFNLVGAHCEKFIVPKCNAFN